MRDLATITLKLQDGYILIHDHRILENCLHLWLQDSASEQILMVKEAELRESVRRLAS